MSNCNCKWGGCVCSKIMTTLVVVGAINWGLVGLGMLLGGKDLNVVHMIFGSMATLEAIIYVLVGVAGVGKLFCCRCKKCMAACATCSCEPENKIAGNM